MLAEYSVVQEENFPKTTYCELVVLPFCFNFQIKSINVETIHIEIRFRRQMEKRLPSGSDHNRFEYWKQGS